MKVTVITIVTDWLGIGRLGNKRASGEHPDCNIMKISQNTEESPGDLRRLDVTQTPVENHQLTPV